MKSGIYAIHHTSGRSYVGSSVNINRRRSEHEGMLLAGAHHCRRLQDAWWQSDGAGFTFEVLETCPISDLATREQAYLDLYGRRRLFNTLLVASPRGGARAYRRTGPFRNDPFCGQWAAGALFVLLLIAMLIKRSLHERT